jgi:hypothetical protein
MIRATSSTWSGRSLLSSVMTCSTDAMFLPYATPRRKSTSGRPTGFALVPWDFRRGPERQNVSTGMRPTL